MSTTVNSGKTDVLAAQANKNLKDTIAQPNIGNNIPLQRQYM